MNLQTKDRVIVKVRVNASPVHNEFRGFRFVVAWPNLDGRPDKEGNSRPSWLKPYLIYTSSDFPRISPPVYFKFVASLQKEGYRHVQLLSDLEPVPFINTVKGFPK